MNAEPDIYERTSRLLEQCQAAREKNLERRREWQRRIELSRPIPHLRKGGIQTEMKLDG